MVTECPGSPCKTDKTVCQVYGFIGHHSLANATSGEKQIFPVRPKMKAGCCTGKSPPAHCAGYFTRQGECKDGQITIKTTQNCRKESGVCLCACVPQRCMWFGVAARACVRACVHACVCVCVCVVVVVRACVSDLRSSSKCVSTPSGPGMEHTSLALRKVVHLLVRLLSPPTSFYEQNNNKPSVTAAQSHFP